MNDFDRAAANAEADLDTMELEDLTGLQVAKWFAENYMTAGHKRLVSLELATLAEQVAFQIVTLNKRNDQEPIAVLDA